MTDFEKNYIYLNEIGLYWLYSCIIYFQIIQDAFNLDNHNRLRFSSDSKDFFPVSILIGL